MEQKLNILIVHNRYRYRGGEDTVVDNEKALLAAHGHNVFTYIRDNTEIATMNVFQKFLLPFTSIYSLKAAKEIKAIIKQNKIDVVHVHNTVALISPSVYAAAKSCGVKVVQTLHNFRFLCPNGLFFRDNHVCEDCLTKGKNVAVKHRCYRCSKLQTILLLLSQKINKFLGNYNKIDTIIALTEFNAEKNALFFDKNKIVVKPNFAHAPQTPIPTPSERHGFVYVGRVEAYKGIFETVDFFIKHPEYDLTIVGTGSDYENVVSVVNKSNAANIHFTGQVSPDEVRRYIGQSRAMIMPSKWYEGFPMTIAEAFSVHTPVIGSNIGNVGSLCRDSVGTFDINDTDNLARYLSDLSDDDFLQAEMDKAFNLYQTKYSDEVNYRLLYEIYTKP